MAGLFNFLSEPELKAQIKDLEDRLRESERIKSDFQAQAKRALEYEASNTTLREKHERLYAEYVKLKEEHTRLLEKPEAAAVPPLPQDAADTAAAVDATALERKLDKLIDLSADNARKDELIKTLHAEVQRLSADMLSNMSKPYLNAVIRIYTHLADVVGKARRDFFESGSADAEIMGNRLDSTLLMVQDLLEDEFDTVPFSPNAGDAYEPRLHYAVQSLPTSDSQIGGTISCCRQCGFRHTADGKILKQAVVIVYRLENNK